MLHPDVLAYTEPNGSNDGAVLILLKRVWKEESE
jgi:DNA-nicking Smr family endonuclease